MVGTQCCFHSKKRAVSPYDLMRIDPFVVDPPDTQLPARSCSFTTDHVNEQPSRSSITLSWRQELHGGAKEAKARAGHKGGTVIPWQCEWPNTRAAAKGNWPALPITDTQPPLCCLLSSGFGDGSSVGRGSQHHSHLSSRGSTSHASVGERQGSLSPFQKNLQSQFRAQPPSHHLGCFSCHHIHSDPETAHLPPSHTVYPKGPQTLRSRLMGDSAATF